MGEGVLFDSDGRGGLRLRMVIEGLPTTFVTDEDMVKTETDGRVRLACLSRRGIDLSVGVDMARAELAQQGFSVSLVERLDLPASPGDARVYAVTDVLAKLATQVSYLTVTIDETHTTSLGVDSTDPFPSSGKLHIGTEVISYTGKTATTFTGLTRGEWDTANQGHFAEQGENLRRPAVRNFPETIEGRRVLLYTYNDDQDPQGDGTLRWRGVVSTSPRLADDGSTWTLLIDPIWTLFQQEFGVNYEGEGTVRGIYYPNSNPLRVVLVEWSDTRISPNATFLRISFPFYGFYETQQEFCEALTAELQTRATAAGMSLSNPAVTPSIRGEGYTFSFTPGGSWTDVTGTARTSARPVQVWFRSEVDQLGNIDAITDSGHDAEFNSYFTDSAGGPVRNGEYVSGETYYAEDASALGADVGGVPRGTFGRVLAPEGWDRGAPTGSSNPDNDLYLQGVPVGQLSALQIAWPQQSPSDVADEEQRTIAYVVNSQVAADLKVNATPRPGGSALRRAYANAGRRYTPLRLPKITASRDLSVGTSGAEGIWVGAALNQIINNAKGSANRGDYPLITSDDVNISDVVTRTFAATRDAPWLRRRIYVLNKATRLDEWLAEELKLLGMYPVIESDGKIGVRRIELPTPTSAVVLALNSTNVVYDTGGGVAMPVFELAAEGYITTLKMLTGYNAEEDEHQGDKFEGQNIRAISERRAPRNVKIEPKSVSFAQDDDITFLDVARLTDRVTGIYGFPYVVIDIPVTLAALFAVNLGDFVSMDLPTLPDMAGGRGFTGKGVVVRRAPPLDGQRAVGTLRVFASLVAVAGYTPTIYATSPSNVSGNQWSFTASATYPGTSFSTLEAGESLTDRWAVGMRVRVVRFDNSSSGDAVGVVDAIGASSITITFDAAYSPASTTVIDYADADDSSLTAAQDDYAYVAGNAAGGLPFPSGTVPPRVFSP